jgi:hypothetical protein
VFTESGVAHVIAIACLSGGALATFVQVSTIPVDGD